MIPVQLTIQGLYSYQEKQTIDFTKLTAANLFGIFGTVGSGKSSVLEAITFALYGKTDRLNLSGDNRNYNMMNLKSNELLIDFTFETGKAQTSYRTIVKGRRNGKNFDDVKALDRSAYQKIQNEWVPIETEAIEKAIGLSYENFKRTIIIPQGQFQEFLQLGNTDRTKMMKELFNLNKFELFNKVTFLESKNNAQKQNLEGQLQQLGPIIPEQVQQFKDQITALKTEIETQTKQQLSFQIQENQWKQLRDLSNKLLEQKKQLEKLIFEKSKFSELEIKLKQYEQCHIWFRSLLDALKTSSKKIEQKSFQIEAENKQLQKTELEIGQQEKEFETIKISYDEREKLRQKAEELDRILQIQNLNKQTCENEDRLKRGNEAQTLNNKHIEKAKLEKVSLEQEIKTAKAKLPDMNILSNVKVWYEGSKNYLLQINEIQNSIEKIHKEIETTDLEFHSLIQQPVFKGISTTADISMSIQFLKEKTKLHKNAISELVTEADHLRVQSKLEDYASELHDGKPCPLCGSLNHPTKFNAASVSESLANVDQTKKVLEEEISLINETSIHLNNFSAKLKFNNDHLVEQQEKKRVVQTKIDQHKSLFIWPEYQQEEAVTKAFEIAESIQNILKEKELALDENSNQFDKLQKDKERYQAEIDNIKTALTVSKTEVKTFSAQLKFLELQEFLSKDSKEIETEKQLLLQKYTQIEKQFNELSNLLIELRKAQNTLIGSLKTNQDELTREQENNARLFQQISLKLNETGYNEIAEVESILSQTIDLEHEKAVLADFKQQLAIALDQTERLKIEIGDKIYDAEAHQTVSNNIIQLNQLLDQKKEEVGKVDELLKKLQKDLESQVALRKELERIDLRAENIKTLKSLFKASGFVNYISSVYLQNLCNAANDRFFQLTRQKLSLEITDDNNFQVRDYLNGGKVRSVKTLSGGQTFQAALSLALALADNIQKITESNQNFFFLDEGFGSLDKDSLAVVFETLKMLRKENRIVGVISHVEEMQQEIDTHLKVTNDPDTGSKISFSWET